ncbi:MAG: FitA-like ribbon-helix-helix domain-containing protein [Terracidiphilus sp.]
MIAHPRYHAIIAITGRLTVATNLIVRNVEPEIVQSLKKQAARNGRSAEAEHRAILEAALRRPRRRPIGEVLASMPNVGRDSDFEFDRN